MHFGSLLSELFKLTRLHKSDYAKAMAYSTGEVSRFISGLRLPPNQRIEEFCESSAAFFAKAFWEGRQQGELSRLFPVMPVIKSHQQLRDFLRQALLQTYANTALLEGRANVLPRTRTVLEGFDEIQGFALLALSRLLAQGKGGRFTSPCPFTCAICRAMISSCGPVLAMAGCTFISSWTAARKPSSWIWWLRWT